MVDYYLQDQSKLIILTHQPIDKCHIVWDNFLRKKIGMCATTHIYDTKLFCECSINQLNKCWDPPNFEQRGAAPLCCKVTCHEQ